MRACVEEEEGRRCGEGSEGGFLLHPLSRRRSCLNGCFYVLGPRAFLRRFKGLSLAVAGGGGCLCWLAHRGMERTKARRGRRGWRREARMRTRTTSFWAVLPPAAGGHGPRPVSGLGLFAHADLVDQSVSFAS